MQARDIRANDKRGRILDAAVKVFAERGFHSATVAGIARAAGVADGTIYLYFKGKDDLLLRLFDEKMTELLAEARAAVERERTAPAKLRRFIQLHLALVERNPELASVLIVELRQSAQFLKAADRQKLAAYGLSDHYREIFELTRLDEAITIYDNEASALVGAAT